MSQNINSLCDNPDSIREVLPALLLYNFKVCTQWAAEFRLSSNNYIEHWKKLPPV